MGEIDVEAIKDRTDLLYLAQKDTSLKRVATTGGGEYAGPCPFCGGGEDRFRLQLKAPPEKLPQGQRWMCRQCSNKWGDVISYVQKRNNVDFFSACELLGGGPVTVAALFSGGKIVLPQPKPKAAPEANVDRARWQHTGLEFVDMCKDLLWKPVGAGALKYLHYRGLNDETLKRWNIGYCPYANHVDGEIWGFAPDSKIWLSKGIVIPCADRTGLHYIKIRRQNEDPKYINISGGEMWPFGLDTFQGALTAIIFEGEFDCMLACQSGLGYGYASLPAGQDWLKPDYEPFFETIEDVFVAFDEDEAGIRAAAKLTNLEHFHQATPLPEGKDLTEYFLLGGNVLDWVFDATEVKP